MRSEQAKTAPVAQKGRAKKKTKSGSATPATPAESGTATPTTPAEPAEPEGKLWEVMLEDTVLFPEGGGQPWDTGRLSLVDANGSSQSFAVEGVVRRGLDAVHIVRVPSSSAIDFGTVVGQEATAEVDWERRLDHMATHTGQHLLSAVLDRRGLNTLSWGMPAYPSTEAPYVELPRGLTWQEAQEVENECNRYIGEDVKVWIDFSVQGSATTEEEERENRGIPKDYSGVSSGELELREGGRATAGPFANGQGVIRHCNITAIDRNACCGTQLPSLSPISFIHVLPPSTPWDSAKTTSTPTRLFFVAGPRAARHLREASRALSRSAQVMGVGRTDLTERLQRTEKVRFETAEREKALKIELTRLLGQRAAEQGDRAKVVRSAPATHDYDALSGVAGAYCDARPQGVVVAVSCAEKPALVVVQSKNEGEAKKVFGALKGGLTKEDKSRVKGGGARGRFMAKVEGKWGPGEEEAVDKALAQ